MKREKRSERMLHVKTTDLQFWKTMNFLEK